MKIWVFCASLGAGLGGLAAAPAVYYAFSKKSKATNGAQSSLGDTKATQQGQQKQQPASGEGATNTSGGGELAQNVAASGSAAAGGVSPSSAKEGTSEYPNPSPIPFF